MRLKLSLRKQNHGNISKIHYYSMKYVLRLKKIAFDSKIRTYFYKIDIAVQRLTLIDWSGSSWIQQENQRFSPSLCWAAQLALLVSIPNNKDADQPTLARAAAEVCDKRAALKWSIVVQAFCQMCWINENRYTCNLFSHYLITYQLLYEISQK